MKKNSELSKKLKKAEDDLAEAKKEVADIKSFTQEAHGKMVKNLEYGAVLLNN